MPRVSVCIPAYSQPEYFRRALTSVLAQHFTDFEIVVADDSPDNTVADIVREAADSRIVYVKNDRRRGSPGNWNVAAEHATGEFVKFLHHDDWFSSTDSLAKYVALLDTDSRAHIGFSASRACDERQRVQRVHNPTQYLDRLRRDPRSLLLGNWIGAPSATIVRRAAGARFDLNLVWVVDIDFYLSVLTRNPHFAYSEEPLVSITDAGPHRVSSDVAQNPGIELFQWFYLYGKWAPRFPIRGERARFLDALLTRAALCSWQGHRRLGLRGRARRLFVTAMMLHSRGLLGSLP
jgi:glycosyltransferase involved in cell wall biosynthesis